MSHTQTNQPTTLPSPLHRKFRLILSSAQPSTDQQKNGERGGWRGGKGKWQQAGCIQRTHANFAMPSPSTRPIHSQGYVPTLLPPRYTSSDYKNRVPYLPSSTLHPPSLLPKLVGGGGRGALWLIDQRTAPLLLLYLRDTNTSIVWGLGGPLSLWRFGKNATAGGGRQTTHTSQHHPPAKNTRECSLSSLSWSSADQTSGGGSDRNTERNARAGGCGVGSGCGVYIRITRRRSWRLPPT